MPKDNITSRGTNDQVSQYPFGETTIFNWWWTIGQSVWYPSWLFWEPRLPWFKVCSCCIFSLHLLVPSKIKNQSDNPSNNGSYDYSNTNRSSYYNSGKCFSQILWKSTPLAEADQLMDTLNTPRPLVLPRITMLEPSRRVLERNKWGFWGTKGSMRIWYLLIRYH